MKPVPAIVGALIAAGLITGLMALGQEVQSTAATSTDLRSSGPPAGAHLVTPPSPAAPLPTPGRVRTGGAFGKFAKCPRPFELLNPLAPPEYGDGTDVLARDPHTGAGDGVTLLSFTFTEKPRKTKPKKVKAAPPSAPQ